jgi:hypothetical protein
MNVLKLLRDESGCCARTHEFLALVIRVVYSRALVFSTSSISVSPQPLLPPSSRHSSLLLLYLPVLLSFAAIPFYIPTLSFFSPAEAVI